MQHYFTGEAPARITKVLIKTIERGVALELYSESGIFSVDKVDRGSHTLIKYAEVPPKARVLDLGCGYGSIGIAIAKAHTDALIEMCDVNMRAVILARRNIQHNNVLNAKVYRSDIYSKVRDMFDLIVTNPPYSAGRKVCFAFIEGAPKFLVQGGSLQLVARHQKGGKMLMAKMEEVFGNVETLAKKSGYRVYKSVR